MNKGQTMAHTALVAAIQAQITVAINNPRDLVQVRQCVHKACQNVGLASQAIYSYKRSNTLIEGASIRLAETLARCFHNLNYGFIEIMRDEGCSLVEAYAVDLQTNIKTQRIFEILHVREVRDPSGKLKTVPLTSSRDIDEAVASWAQRRVRGCILQIIPADIVSDAVATCKKVISGGKVDVGRVAKMINAYAKIGISKQTIEAKYGKVEHLTPENYGQLQVAYSSIVNDDQDPSIYFNIPKTLTQQTKQVEQEVKTTPSQHKQTPSRETLVEMEVDYGTGELAPKGSEKKGRGRPRGSKNKPKPQTGEIVSHRNDEISQDAQDWGDSLSVD